MSLLDANMVGVRYLLFGFDANGNVKVAFQTSTFMLITMGLLILAGNTW